MPDEAVLIVCSERSGSNLLKAMLNQSPSVFVGPPIPLFECFQPIIDFYGDLSHDCNWHDLLTDVTDLLTVNHQPIPCDITFEDLQKCLENHPKNWGGLIDGVFGLIATHQCANIRGCKYSTQMENLGKFLTQTHFSKIIYQIRDPRDVALSHHKGGFSDKSPSCNAAYWLKSQRNALDHIEASGLPVLKIKYESLIEKPDQTIHAAWKFLGAEETQNALEFYRDKHNVLAATRTHLWKNLGKPIKKRNSGKYLQEWNFFEVFKIECALGAGLGEFDYQRTWPLQYASLFRRSPSQRPIAEQDRAYIQPQLEKWKEIHDRAAKRTAQI